MTSKPIMIDPKTVLTDFKGKPLVKSIQQGEEPSDVTFGRVVQFAMDIPLRTDESQDHKYKWTLFKIGEKCEQIVTNFTAKETEIILERVAKLFGGLIYGRVKELVEPEPVAEPPKVEPAAQ